MIYDPKKPLPDPIITKKTPRYRDGVAGEAKALHDGFCNGCRKPYRASDDVINYLPLGSHPAPTETWHPACWRESNRDLSERPKQWPYL